jgi:hypothetical protein
MHFENHGMLHDQKLGVVAAPVFMISNIHRISNDVIDSNFSEFVILEFRIWIFL